MAKKSWFERMTSKQKLERVRRWATYTRVIERFKKLGWVKVDGVGAPYFPSVSRLRLGSVVKFVEVVINGVRHVFRAIGNIQLPRSKAIEYRECVDYELLTAYGRRVLSRNYGDVLYCIPV